MLLRILLILMVNKSSIRTIIIGTPGGKALPLGVKLVGEVDIGAAVQQIAQVQARAFEMNRVDLEVAPI